MRFVYFQAKYFKTSIWIICPIPVAAQS